MRHIIRSISGRHRVSFSALLTLQGNNKMSTTTAARIHPTAAALSSTIKHHLLLRPSHRRHVVFRNNTSFSRRPMLTMASAPTPLQVCVKSSITVPNKLGDCNSFFLSPCFSLYFPYKINAMSSKSCSARFSGPFCQRVLLTLEEKHLPFELKLVDLPTSQTGTFLPFLSSNLHLQIVFIHFCLLSLVFV